MTPDQVFRDARDVLMRAAGDVEAARTAFRWPALDEFNWTTHWFDPLAIGNRRDALRIVGDVRLRAVRRCARGRGRATFVAAAARADAVGRGDDVFKSSDYRISPFELESVLLEHDDVAEAAIVPSPDRVRLAVPKAFIVLRPGVEASRDVARSIFAFCRTALAPCKQIRRLEFAALPKTISGRIRRVELRQREAARRASGVRGPSEFWSDDQ